MGGILILLFFIVFVLFFLFSHNLLRRDLTDRREIWQYLRQVF